MNEKKLLKIGKYPTPTNKYELQRFLGMAGYYRKFIKNFGTISGPLSDVTGSNSKFIWGPDQAKAFQELKDSFEKNVILKHPDYTKPFMIETDASGSGIGAVLLQKDTNGQERPVFFASRKLTPGERKWITRDQEGLAIVYGVTTFRHHILGTHFTVRTDHRSLEWLMDAKKGRPARWSIILS